MLDCQHDDPMVGFIDYVPHPIFATSSPVLALERSPERRPTTLGDRAMRPEMNS